MTEQPQENWSAQLSTSSAPERQHISSVSEAAVRSHSFCQRQPAHRTRRLQAKQHATQITLTPQHKQTPHMPQQCCAGAAAAPAERSHTFASRMMDLHKASAWPDVNFWVVD
jgi:hypothetical protein